MAARKPFLLMAVLMTAFVSCTTSVKRAVPVLHITDLTRPYGDPDDHWDAACEFALAKKGLVDLKGVVIDNIPHIGSPDIAAISELNSITSMCVPVGVGQGVADTLPNSGLELIHKTLLESRRPVTIHILGGCLDIVKAYELWPDLFRKKVKALYLNAGSSLDTPIIEYNVALHPLEYSKMFSLPCRVYWMPCMDDVDEWCRQGGYVGNYSTYYRFRQGDLFEGMDNRLLGYFDYALSRSTSSDWLTPITANPDPQSIAAFGAQSRNMWCTAGFLHAAGLTVWKDGTIHPLGEDPSSEIFRFLPIEATCTPEGRVCWREAASSGKHSSAYHIFQVTDPALYESAMTRALSTLLGWL